MAIKYSRYKNRLWVSMCGKYYIEAQGVAPGYTYTARYERAPGKFDQLGQFHGGTALDNANAAKEACTTHAALLPAFGETSTPEGAQKWKSN